MKIKLFALLFTAFSTFSLALNDNKERILLLPFNSIGIDTISLRTAESIFKFELNKTGIWETITADEKCLDENCAISIGERNNAQKVFLSSFSRLGEKIIIQYLLIDVRSSKTIVSDNTSALSIEDLENVMKRIALSVTKQEPVEKTAEIGAITEKETVPELRRRAERTTGFSFGYLFPQDGYDNEDRSFAFEFRTGFEMEESAVGLMLAIRRGFAANVYGSYLFTKTDVCPYIGGAFGFHWVTHNYSSRPVYSPEGQYLYASDEKKDNGFEFTANTGLRLFHTYDFQILLNLDYIITLNDFNDKALIFTIGVLW